MEIDIAGLLQVWEMYHNNPVFWIIALPLLVILVLWLWNIFKRQLEESGLKKLVSLLVLFVKNRILNRRTEYRYTVTPSPKSGSPVNFWNEIRLWLVLMSPFIIFLAISTEHPPFSLQWWTVIGWSIVVLIGILGIPIYASALTLCVRTNNTIKKASQKLSQIKTDDNVQSGSYLDIFIVVSDDLQMGLDPRVLPIAYPQNQIDTLSFLDGLVCSELIQPDKKTKRGSLANRYYLTRNGATLVKKMKQKKEAKK
ncbi:hypothetical protein ACFLUK_02770 [Chloroflexota bacterium]